MTTSPDRFRQSHEQFARARKSIACGVNSAVRAFKQGMAPVVIALLIATGWILASANVTSLKDWPLIVLTGVTALVVWRTRLHLLWLLGAGAVLGWFSWV